MLRRLTTWLGAVAVGLTQFGINTLCAGLWWVLTGRGRAPNPDETFSGRVGRNAIKGKRWALLAEKIIDGIFSEGHCRNSIETFG